MKRGLVIILLALFAINFVAGICDLEVSLLNQDPYPAVPGDYVKLVFQIKDISGADCNDMTFKLVEKYFTPEEVKGADSAFFTGTAAEVAGIASLDRVNFKMKWEDSMGSILQAKYTRRVAYNEYGNFTLVV